MSVSFGMVEALISSVTSIIESAETSLTLSHLVTFFPPSSSNSQPRNPSVTPSTRPPWSWLAWVHRGSSASCCWAWPSSCPPAFTFGCSDTSASAAASPSPSVSSQRLWPGWCEAISPCLCGSEDHLSRLRALSSQAEMTFTKLWIGFGHTRPATLIEKKDLFMTCQA